MSQQPPPLIHYQQPIAPEPVRQPFGKFALGVIAGNAAVGVGIAACITAEHPWPVIATGLLEFAGGIIIVIKSRPLRPFGIGLICAVPISLMLFAVGCAILLGVISASH